MIYYYLYKIINTINNKIYIGVHKTSNLNDGYMGSGKVLKRSIEKYGIDVFEKKIIQYFDSSDEMFKMESQLVNDEFIKRDDTYNIKEGGFGGWEYIQHNKLFSNRRNGGLVGGKYHANKMKTDQEYYNIITERLKTSTKKRLMNGGKLPDWTGKRHSEESKQKIGKANSKYQRGSGNSQYGTCWIYNIDLKESKKIQKIDINKWIQKGWIKGRKMIF